MKKFILVAACFCLFAFSCEDFPDLSKENSGGDGSPSLDLQNPSDQDPGENLPTYYTQEEVDAIVEDAVADLQAQIDALTGGAGTDLATLQARVNTNTTDIASNDTDIATNLGNITGNSAAIAGHDLLLEPVSVTLTGATVTGFIFTGVNVQVLSGSGATEGAINGRGNLIVGYNENEWAWSRTGSHNIVVGYSNGYSSYGGLVLGHSNRISAPYASVSAGSGNVASGNYSSVSGGYLNTASGSRSSVSGGNSNKAGAIYSSVSGGLLNAASGSYSAVSGGRENSAAGNYSTVSGGHLRFIAGGDEDGWAAGNLWQDF